eukprot:14882484-Alexandrium_andersonii.AAC.1
MTAQQKRIVTTHIPGNAYKVCLPVVCVLSDVLARMPRTMPRMMPAMMPRMVPATMPCMMNVEPSRETLQQFFWSPGPLSCPAFHLTHECNKIQPMSTGPCHILEFTRFVEMSPSSRRSCQVARPRSIAMLPWGGL